MENNGYSQTKHQFENTYYSGRSQNSKPAMGPEYGSEPFAADPEEIKVTLGFGAGIPTDNVQPFIWEWCACGFSTDQDHILPVH